MKISTSWGSGKISRRRKRTVLKTKIRWNLLGLQDPAHTESKPSMEDIRRQIISMASRGLGPDTRARSIAKNVPGLSVANAMSSTRKRRRIAAE